MTQFFRSNFSTYSL